VAEQVAEMVLVDAETERREVEEAFMRTLTGRGIQVWDVHRVQNTEMWKIYALKRQSILERSAWGDALAYGGDANVLQRFERRWLFHGTKKYNVPAIIQQGFNCFFCGLKMTRYGKGVYFARDSLYSSNLRNT